MKFLKLISRNLRNIPGWRTNRKIVVIESDDWGSVRIPSKEAIDRLLSKGVKFDIEQGYERFDSLASEEDLNQLFDLLCSHKDKNGRSPVITANCVMANPDFEKIMDSGFQDYYFEPFTDTLKRSKLHENSFSLWKKGIDAQLFFPQLHGREHLNVSFWMNALRNDLFGVRESFQERLWGCLVNDQNENRTHFLAAYDYRYPEEENFILDSITEGAEMFEKLFGFQSKSFIAPCYVWNKQIEARLKQCGVEYLQGGVYQLLPTIDQIASQKKMQCRTLGEQNEFDQCYLVRNCFFEPSQAPHFDYVEDCLSRIEVAFRWNKPAIICTHRLNFIGSIDPRNREWNLKSFDMILKQVLSRWPDVEFMTSVELGNLIAEK